MVVLDRKYVERCDRLPVQPSIGFRGRGIVIRTEDDPESLVRMHGELSRAITFQFFAVVVRDLANYREILRSREVVEPLPDLLPTLQSELLLQQPVAVAEISKARVLE
jgi:hypothetical protein